MDWKNIFGFASILSFFSILFMPLENNALIFPLSLGIIFGILWYLNKDE